MFNNSSHVDASHSTFSDVHRDQYYNARSTVTGHQTINTIIHGNQIVHDHEPNGIQALKMASASSAAHDSAQRFPAPNCIEGTRSELLSRLASWIDEPDQKPICWLNGRPGSGKSAVAQTIADKYAVQNRLAASFFFSRRDFERRTTYHVVPTLTMQLLGFLPSFRPAVMTALETDYMLPAKVLREQMEKLLFGPLSTAMEAPDAPILIVIDALDECDDDSLVSELVTLLALFPGKTSLQLRLLITSRPEPWLQSHFHRRDISSLTLPLDIHTFSPEADIRSFLRHALDDAYDQHLQVMEGVPRPWPPSDELEHIVNKAGGLFIFALTVVKFVGDKIHNPIERLQAILGDKVLVSDGSAYTDLDSLYRDAISVFPDPDVARLILGVVYCMVIPLSISALHKLLHRPDADPRIIVPSLSSVLASEDGKQPIQFYHASFRDFLINPQRSQEYAIIPDVYHGLMAQSCLETMSNSLKRDMCGIGNPATANNEVPDLVERQRAAFDEALLYACRFWSRHLAQLLGDGFANEALLGALKKFSTTVLLCWIEALSLFGELDKAVIMLREGIRWLKTLREVPRDTMTLLQDADRLVVLYMDCISECALHVHLSAISILPANSAIYRTFKQQSFGNIVMHPDYATGWDSLRISVNAHNPIHSVAFSPSGHLIATAGVEHGVRVWNVITGRNVASLGNRSSTSLLVRFSPSGKYLAAALDDHTVITWDPNAGREHFKNEGCHTKLISCLEFSENSVLLASGSRDNTLHVWSMETAQALYRLATHEGPVTSLVFSNDSLRLVSGSEDNLVIVWDMSVGKVVRGLMGHRGPVNCVSLSKDGSVLASGSEDKTIKIWDTTSGKCMQTLSRGHHTGIRSIRFFDEDKSIITACDEAILSWNLALHNRSHTIWTTEQFFKTAMKRIPIWQANVIGWGTPKHVMRYIVHLAFTESVKRRLTTAHATQSPSFAFTTVDLLFSTSLTSPVDDLPLNSSGTLNAIAVSPDGNWAVAAGALGSLQIYDLSMPKPTWEDLEVAAKSNPIRTAEHFVPSPNGTRFVVGNIMQWSLVDANYHIVKKIDMGMFGSMRDDEDIRFKFSPDGSIFFCVVSSLFSDDRNTLRVFDSMAGEQRAQFKGLKKVHSFVPSIDGKWIACGHGPGHVDIFDTTNKARTSLVESDADGSPINVLVFSRNAQVLIGGSIAGVVRVWDRGSAACQAKFEASNSMVTALACASTVGETRVAIGRADGSLSLWSPSTSRSHDVAHSDQVAVKDIDFVNFSDDQSRLTTRCGDGTVFNWAIAFDSDDSRMERCALCSPDSDGASNRRLPHLLSQSDPEDVADSLFHTPYRVRKDGWIVKGDRRVLWLPLFLRPRGNDAFYAYEDRRAAIRTPSDRLIFLKWDE